MKNDDQVALIDLDGTIADYDASLEKHLDDIRNPEETLIALLKGNEPSFLEHRRKLIQRQPGFWRTLPRIELGFDIVSDLRDLGFDLHILTKGPAGTPTAWTEKFEWCRENISDALITITQDKSLSYGRVLVDDYPPYFEKWLAVRPRGLVVCVAHKWNEDFRIGGAKEHANIIRYDGTNRKEVQARLTQAFLRKSGE